MGKIISDPSQDKKWTQTSMKKWLTLVFHKDSAKQTPRRHYHTFTRIAKTLKAPNISFVTWCIDQPELSCTVVQTRSLMELSTHLPLDLAVLLLNIKHMCKQKIKQKYMYKSICRSFTLGEGNKFGIFTQQNASTSDTHDILHESQRHTGDRNQ